MELVPIIYHMEKGTRKQKKCTCMKTLHIKTSEQHIRPHREYSIQLLCAVLTNDLNTVFSTNYFTDNDCDTHRN